MLTYVISEAMLSVVMSLKIVISRTGGDDSSVATIFTSGFRQRLSDILYCFVLYLFVLIFFKSAYSFSLYWPCLDYCTHISYFSSEAIEIVPSAKRLVIQLEIIIDLWIIQSNYKLYFNRLLTFAFSF